jgi:50S ribosomal protein L16 3-hydroxylase
MMRPMTVLGRLSPSTFLRDYWHREPLLIRQAIPGFAGILDRDALLALAARPDAVSRLVLEHPRRRTRWERHDGPFAELDAAMLPASHWTLLVHGVESLVPGGWELLRRFVFVPAARIDDLMISFAAEAGSVGPHDDLYDVFLLQGPGRRRWQVSRGGERAVDPDAAISGRGRVGAGAGRHALPAAGGGALGRGAGAVLHLLDRLSGAVAP